MEASPFSLDKRSESLKNAKKNHKVHFEYVREGNQAYCIVDKLDQISELESSQIRNKFLERGIKEYSLQLHCYDLLFSNLEKDKNLAVNLSNEFKDQIIIINNDVLKVNEKKMMNEENNVIVFGNLPYNISTEILCKWILNLDKNNFWFNKLILMFQKEVANRIIADYNTSDYGRLSIIANWKLNIKKITDIKPQSFSPKPKVDSSVLVFTPKNDFFQINDNSPKFDF